MRKRKKEKILRAVFNIYTHAFSIIEDERAMVEANLADLKKNPLNGFQFGEFPMTKEHLIGFKAGLRFAEDLVETVAQYAVSTLVPDEDGMIHIEIRR